MLPAPFRLNTARLLAVSLSLFAGAAQAQDDAPFSAADIDAASYDGRDLPSGRSAITTRVQVLLDRSGTSPGVIDGFRGGMSQSAIMAFERRSGLPMDGVMDPHVWNLLQSYADQPATQDYTITDEDAQGLVDSIPTDYAEKAAMPSMGYTSLAEKLAERFHMDEKFIAFLNPGVPLQPGSTIKVVAPGSRATGQVTRILIDKATRRVAGYGASGQMIVDYPATIGSDDTPSPAGNHTVVTAALNPNYTYNPQRNFKQGDNDRPLVVPPGPNGPVGTVWIGLSKPSYGIHGTPTPSQLFRNQSRGCVRLTNWDAEELARLVKSGVTTVEFLPTGVTIADATGVTPMQAPAVSEPLTTGEDVAQPAVTEAGQEAAPTESSPTSPAATAPEAGADLAFPDPAVAMTPPADALHEDTSERDDPSGDPLSDALSGVLPEGFVVPPATEQPQP